VSARNCAVYFRLKLKRNAAWPSCVVNGATSSLRRHPGFANTREIVKLVTLSEMGQLFDVWMDFAKQCVQPAHDYVGQLERELLRDVLPFYRAVLLFNPAACKLYGLYNSFLLASHNGFLLVVFLCVIDHSIFF
jgi:hypothetical protein